MTLDAKLSGARLIGFRYGLVADLMHENNYTSLYYRCVIFRRGLTDTLEFYPVRDTTQQLLLHNIGKIVKEKEVTENSVTYRYTDGSWDTFGG